MSITTLEGRPQADTGPLAAQAAVDFVEVMGVSARAEAAVARRAIVRMRFTED
jgi:hypothetical protein